MASPGRIWISPARPGAQRMPRSFRKVRRHLVSGCSIALSPTTTKAHERNWVLPSDPFGVGAGVAPASDKNNGGWAAGPGAGARRRWPGCIEYGALGSAGLVAAWIGGGRRSRSAADLAEWRTRTAEWRALPVHGPGCADGST